MLRTHTTENGSKPTKKMKSNYSLAILIAGMTLIVTSTSVRASDTDDRIESSAKKSHVFKTYLKDDSIKTRSKDGNVTLTGTVASSSHSSFFLNLKCWFTHVALAP